MTGRLYLSTNCAKAPLSPCLTRNIRAASGSSSADIMNQFNRHPDGDKVMGKRKIPRVVTGNQAPKAGDSHCPFNRSSDRLCRSADEPPEAFGSASGLLALSGHPPRPKAGASSTHSMRFATFGCGFAGFAARWQLVLS